MSESRAIKRYADAIYLLARERGDESLWNEELEKTLVVLDVPEVSRILSHPRLDLSKKWEILETFFGKGKMVPLRKETRNLLKLLLQNQRTSLWASILKRFQASWEKDRGTVFVRLTTVMPLTLEEKGAVKGSLETSLGKTVRLEEMVDPSILGGAMIQIEDQLIDGSLREKVKRMRETLVA